MKTKTLLQIRSTNSEYRILRIPNKQIKKFVLLNSSILLFFCSFILLSLPSIAQAPEAIKYQAVLRDNAGELLVNQSAIMQISIENSSATVLYQETHSVTTNDYGLVTLNIGEGTVESGIFSAIDWGVDDYFIKIEVNTGSGYVDMGTTQLLSVPYALHAKNTDSWSVNGNSVFTSRNVGIGTSTPAALLHTNGTGTGEGNVLFEGEYKNVAPGDPPASGAGTRMMWYPDKAAFRVGGVGGVNYQNNWDKDSIGHYSLALNNNTKAKGFASVAVGNRTQALANSSTAMGYGTTASGFTSTAMGHQTIASGDYSTAMGTSANATGIYSFAINLSATAGPSVGANTFRISGAISIGGNLAWTNHSDRRLKKNIELLSAENNIGKIMQLNGVRYEWKEYNDNLNLGFIAQDVVDILPEAVRYDADNDVYSMEYTAIIPILVEGMKEQQNIIVSLQTQNESQQSDIEALKQMIEQQQIQISALLQMNTSGAESVSK